MRSKLRSGLRGSPTGDGSEDKTQGQREMRRPEAEQRGWGWRAGTAERQEGPAEGQALESHRCGRWGGTGLRGDCRVPSPFL